MTEANRDDVIDLMNENTRLLAEVERLRGVIQRAVDGLDLLDQVDDEWLGIARAAIAEEGEP